MIPGFEKVNEQLDALTVRGDLISRQAAVEVVKRHYRAHDNDLLELIAYELEKLPTAEPERKRGNWVYEKEMQCSCCGFTCDDPYYLGAANYCPECGAKMEAEE